MMKNWILVLMTALALVACGGGGSDSGSSTTPPTTGTSPGTTPGTTPGVTPGTTPGSDRPNPFVSTIELSDAQDELLGVDTDANGVHDAAQTSLASKYGQSALLQKAVQAMAKDIARAVVMDETFTATQESVRFATYLCAADEADKAGLPNSSDILIAVAIEVLDTPARQTAYLKWRRHQTAVANVPNASNPCAAANLL